MLWRKSPVGILEETEEAHSFNSSIIQRLADYDSSLKCADKSKSDHHSVFSISETFLGDALKKGIDVKRPCR